MPVAMSRVSCRPKLDLPSDPSKSRKSLETQKIQALVGDFELRLICASPTWPPTLDLPRRIMRIGDANVVFLLHAINEFSISSSRPPSTCICCSLLAQFLVEQIVVHKRLLDGAAQVIQSLLTIRLS